MLPVSFQFPGLLIFAFNVEARPLRVDESKNVKGSLMTRSKGKVAEARGRLQAGRVGCCG